MLDDFMRNGERHTPHSSTTRYYLVLHSFCLPCLVEQLKVVQYVV